MVNTFGALVALISVASVHAEAPRGRHSTEERVRGGSWIVHANESAPCAFVPLTPNDRTCRFVPDRIYDVLDEPFAHTVHGPHVDFALSTETLHQLDRLDVQFILNGMSAPGIEDWVGVYCMDAAKPAPDGDFIDWQWVNASKIVTVDEGEQRRQLGFGPMVNMRCVWQFRYFTTVSHTPVTYKRLGVSKTVQFAKGDTEPLQVHLAVTGNPSEMKVMWVSSTVADAHVQYGTDPRQLAHTARANHQTYAAHDMCQEGATIVSARLFRDPGMLYDATMTNLAPGQVVYYQVGSAQGMSRLFKFRVPPVRGHHPSGTIQSFFMYADLGEWTTAATGLSPPIRSGTTIELVLRELEASKERPHQEYVALLHDGDLSYARGMAFQWDQFGALIEPVATQLPYMVSIGNHEYDHTSGGEKDPSRAPGNGWHPSEGNYGIDSNGECGVPTAKRFLAPTNGNLMFWYSFEMGLVHHSVISSEHDYTPGSPMYTWLEHDLRHIDRRVTPWVMLHLHRPMYCSEQYDSDRRTGQLIRRHLEPLLVKYRVDIVFSGHYHAFERTCPVYEENCHYGKDGHSAAGPVHIMIGSAGAEVDNVGYDPVQWSAARMLEYGYGRVHVHNATHVFFEFQRNRDGEVADHAWIVSEHAW